MADIEWLVEEIDNSPEGPNIGAFFDFDGTLIAGYSAAAFFTYRLKRREISTRELMRTVAEGVNVERRGHDVTELMNVGAQGQAGRSAEEVERWARTVFAANIAEMIYPDARTLIDAHLRKHHTVVVASSATRPQIQATADDLGIDHILCTELEVDDEGLYTGALASPIRWGEGKSDAVVEFADEYEIDLDESFGYSNGGEDVPFLETVGRPCALNPDESLEEIATDHSWPVARLVEAQSTGPVDLVRSVAAISVFAGSVGAAGALAVLNRSRSLGANVAASVGCDLGLATAGVRLRVVGEDNVWAARPAVFLFNHQSQLDAFVLGALLRKDFTGVAKKSLERDPMFAPVGFLADVAYIDRTDSAKARQGLEPAVDALRNGKSIAIAPEGTRAPTPRLLPFKKGPFHMAMQAGVPIVPIVMRNCGEIMAAHSMAIHPGTVDVAVLPPIPTEDWTTEDLNEHVAEVRQMYLDTLADWPTTDD
ncbi:MAG: HAD-IB family hydrolase [Actinomycetota bacterium]|nr:HAD-IB family hydrolase [Actinomycetota bacterium]MDH4017122.1 HAD-IB family hydrolase [Actinomycetota bacterium]